LIANISSAALEAELANENMIAFFSARIFRKKNIDCKNGSRYILILNVCTSA
jgi:hypothetical protein